MLGGRSAEWSARPSKPVAHDPACITMRLLLEADVKVIRSLVHGPQCGGCQALWGSSMEALKSAT